MGIRGLCARDVGYMRSLNIQAEPSWPPHPLHLDATTFSSFLPQLS